MKLYYSQYSRAHRPRWVLEELGVPYELQRIDISKGEQKSPEYLKVHPLGQLPALQDEGKVLIESAAICMYLADKYPDKGLAPAPGTIERGQYYQWVLFIMATLESPLGLYYMHTRGPEAKRVPAQAAQAKEQGVAALQVLEAAVTGRDFIVGSRFTAADVLVATTLQWAGFTDILEGFPTLQAYLKRHLERPAARRAYAD